MIPSEEDICPYAQMIPYVILTLLIENLFIYDKLANSSQCFSKPLKNSNLFENFDEFWLSAELFLTSIKAELAKPEIRKARFKSFCEVNNAQMVYSKTE